MLCPIEDGQEEACRDCQEDIQKNLPSQTQATDLQGIYLNGLYVAPEGPQHQIGVLRGGAEAEGQVEVDQEVDGDKDGGKDRNRFGGALGLIGCLFLPVQVDGHR